MVTIECESCKSRIPKKSDVCPKCGHPTQRRLRQHDKDSGLVWVFRITLGVFFGQLIYFFVLWFFQGLFFS